jgi:putative membrane protein
MINVISYILTLAVALEHIFIMLLEMFFIQSSVAQRAFGTDKRLLERKEVRVMFANQGLYNGFLAAGLLWSLFSPETMAVPLRYFFLGCVIVAAIYGSLTANKKIIFTQGSMAIVAMILLIVSNF